MTCPSCSAEVPADARFCPSCGHPLRAPGDERRVVTVLFGDIVGFTGLSESRDPETVKNLVDRCFARLAVDIRSFGGTLDKVVGDAVVALFGAPVAHEDDAERAVRAALQMQRTLADMAPTLGVDVKMRIGVNTGEVLVGALRAGGDYTAMGDVVNTASRLETLAEPGRVVVGPETHAATEGVFRYEPLGLLQPRGRERGVEAWLAVEAVLQPGRRPPRRRSNRLVGRTTEAELLTRVIDSAFTHRRPTLVVLLGEAGVGKSRLAEDVVLAAINERQAQVLSGRAVPYGAANAWWPIAEVMQSACGVGHDESPEEARQKCVRTVRAALGPDATEEEVGRIVDGLLYLIGIGASLADVESRRAADEVARAVRTFVEALAGKRPLVVTLGDVQWADPSVLFGLDDMMSRLHRVPLVVLLTGRPELEETWRPVAHQNLLVLHLDPLDDEAAAELLISLLGSDPGVDVRHDLVERSGGNPLFVEELAALLAERETDGAGVGVLPATLRGIVAARLDALPAAERAVLDDAAVVGRRAPMSALLALGGSRGGVPEAVQDLIGKDLLALEEGLIEFRSDLVREVVYGMLTKAERARRHATLARWLEEQSGVAGASDEVLGEQARHWATAAELSAELGGIDGVPPGVHELAVAALRRAGERAEDRELHVVTIRLYDRLVQLLGDAPSAAHRQALVGRARAATALRRDEEALADLDGAEAEARSAGDDDTLARALTVRGDLLRNTGDYRESLSCLEEARMLWQRVGDRRGEGSALRRIGWTKLFAGDLDGAEPVLIEALEAFRQSGALRGQAWSHQNLAWAAYGRGETALAEQRLHDSMELFRQIGDWGGLNWTTGMLGWVRFGQGHVAEAEEHAVVALAEARDQGDTWQVGMMTVLLAAIRLWQGRALEAVELGRSAGQLFAEIGDEWGEIQAGGPLAGALVQTGRFEEAERVRSEAAARVNASNGFSDSQVYPRVADAVSAVRLGEPERALAALAGDATVPGDTRFGSVDLLVARGLALLQLGRAAEAVELLEGTVQPITDPGPQAHALAALALALAADRQPARAREVAARVAAGEASYLDRSLADLAAAGAAAQEGDLPAAVLAADRAERVVSTTQDRLATTIVAMAKAQLLAVLGDPFAGGAHAEAQERLRALGIPLTGWEQVVRMAVGRGVSPEASEAPGAG